jgi:hypothetical protein
VNAYHCTNPPAASTTRFYLSSLTPPLPVRGILLINSRKISGQLWLQVPIAVFIEL